MKAFKKVNMIAIAAVVGIGVMVWLFLPEIKGKLQEKGLLKG
jgi:hypothetical protein